MHCFFPLIALFYTVYGDDRACAASRLHAGETGNKLSRGAAACEPDRTQTFKRQNRKPRKHNHVYSAGLNFLNMVQSYGSMVLFKYNGDIV